MAKKTGNVAFIYAPHYNSGCFRAAVVDQQGEVNYIVVCNRDSSYYGVYKWTREDVPEPGLWSNNRKLCYCVPISKCTKIQEELTKPDNIKRAEAVYKRFKEKEAL